MYSPEAISVLPEIVNDPLTTTIDEQHQTSEVFVSIVIYASAWITSHTCWRRYRTCVFATFRCLSGLRPMPAAWNAATG